MATPVPRGPQPQLLIGRAPIDLGGIGKGFAIRRATEKLEGEVDDFLIEAGGDIACRGSGLDGHGWRVGVEDPTGSSEPLAVVQLHDQAIATSSVRVRRWRCAGRPVHHLVDPRNGRPGGHGLLAVSVLARDPVEAEVLSKALFFEGRERIEGVARREGVAALWVRTDGRVGETPGMEHAVIWRSARMTGVGRPARNRREGAPRQQRREVGSAAIVLAASMGVGALLARHSGGVIHDRMFPWIMSRCFGLAAYVSLTALVVVGVWFRHPWRVRRRTPSPQALLRAHVALTAATLVLLAGHIVAVALDRYAGVGWVGTFLPGQSSYRAFAVGLGSMAMYGIVMVTATAALAGSLSRRFWLPVHHLSSLWFGAALVHGVLGGSDSRTLWWMYAGSGLLVLTLQATKLTARPVLVVDAPSPSPS